MILALLLIVGMKPQKDWLWGDKRYRAYIPCLPNETASKLSDRGLAMGTNWERRSLDRKYSPSKPEGKSKDIEPGEGGPWQCDAQTWIA